MGDGAATGAAGAVEAGVERRGDVVIGRIVMALAPGGVNPAPTKARGIGKHFRQLSAE